MAGVDAYRVELDNYDGPLDLLLYLIRRDEIDIYDIPILRITEQFVRYVEILKQIDPEVVGDFLVMAATLMEIKSRALLPLPPPTEEEGELIDPRLELVRQLLEYKTYKDAARSIELSAQVQSLRHPREPVMPDAPDDDVDLDHVDIWDLLDAFSKLLEVTGGSTATHHVQTDDTPLLVYLDGILERLDVSADGSVTFALFFEDRSKAQMIGLFLAMLELIRRKRIRVAQDAAFGEIVVILLDATPVDELVDDYAYAEPDESDMIEGSAALIDDENLRLDDEGNGYGEAEIVDDDDLTFADEPTQLREDDEHD